jgi:hypothetical protein
VHLEIQFYAYNGGFVRYGATSLGEWAPNITLAYESGFAVIFLDSPAYFRHFHVRAYGKLASPASYQGWSWSDAAVAGDAVSPKSVPYGAVKFGATPTVGSTPLSLEGHTHAWSDITGAPVYATRWPTLAEIGAAAGSGFTINQNLRTTDAPSFAGLTLTGNLNNTTRFSFLNGAGGAQVIMTGGVLISNSYGDVSLVPTNGLSVKGDARFNGGSTGGIYIDGGWVRVLGNNGIWFETWAGGFHMEDSTYIRSNKSVLTTLDMVAARFVDVSNVGCYLDPAGTSVLETVQLVDRIRSTGATPISMDIAAGGNRYPYIEWKYGGVRGAYMGWGTPGTQLDLTLENGNKLAINGNVTVSGGFNVGANGIGTTGGITAAGDIETGGTLKDQWTESGGGIMIAHVISRSAAAGFDPNLSAPDGTFQAIWD